MASQYVLKDGSVQWMADQLVWIQGRQIRRRKKGFPTKEEAETYEQTLLRTTSKGRTDPEVEEILANEERKREAQDRPPAQAVFHSFLQKRTNDGVKENTLLHYRQSWGQLKPLITDSFWRLTQTDVDRVVTADLRKSNKNRVKMLLLLYRFARERFEGLPRLDIPEKYMTSKQDVMILTPDDFNRFIGAEDNEYYKQIWLFLAYSGLRIGEALALDWSDLYNNQIRVSKTQLRMTNIIQETSKTGKIRTVPIHPVTQQCLDYFKGQNTQPIRIIEKTRSAVYQKLRRLKEANNLPDGLKCHSMRHYFGSRLAQAKADPVSIRDLLGHSTLAMTSHYLHQMDDSSRLAVLSLP